MSFRPAPVRRPREQVEEQLREAILSGTFGRGERLPSELELAKSFGVSRATVREALGGLASEGLIRRSPGAGGGSFVRAVNHESLGLSLGQSIENTLKLGSIDYEEINQLRRLLEVPSARQAALRRTDADVERLRGIIDRQKVVSVDDPEAMELDSRLHTAVAEASRNRVLASFVFALHRVLRELLFLDITPAVGSAAVRQHIAIVQAITDGDEAAAGKAMEEHLDYLDRLHAWRERSGTGSDRE